MLKTKIKVIVKAKFERSTTQQTLQEPFMPRCIFCWQLIDRIRRKLYTHLTVLLFKVFAASTAFRR